MELDGAILDVEQIVERWGEGFRALASNSRVHFGSEAISVDLREPILTLDGGEPVRQLRVPQPRTRHIEAMDDEKGEVAKARAMLCSLCGIAHSKIKDMPVSDFILLQSVIAGFLADDPATSGT